MNTLLVITLLVAVLVWVLGVAVLCWWVEDDLVAEPPSESVTNIDMWTEERRQRLADLQRPAAKFIDARRTRR